MNKLEKENIKIKANQIKLVFGASFLSPMHTWLNFSKALQSKNEWVKQSVGVLFFSPVHTDILIVSEIRHWNVISTYEATKGNIGKTQQTSDNIKIIALYMPTQTNETETFSIEMNFILFGEDTHTYV